MTELDHGAVVRETLLRYAHRWQHTHKAAVQAL